MLTLYQVPQGSLLHSLKISLLHVCVDWSLIAEVGSENSPLQTHFLKNGCARNSERSLQLWSDLLLGLLTETLWALTDAAWQLNCLCLYNRIAKHKACRLTAAFFMTICSPPGGIPNFYCLLLFPVSLWNIICASTGTPTVRVRERLHFVLYSSSSSSPSPWSYVVEWYQF